MKIIKQTIHDGYDVRLIQKRRIIQISGYGNHVLNYVIQLRICGTKTHFTDCLWLITKHSGLSYMRKNKLNSVVTTFRASQQALGIVNKLMKFIIIQT